LSYKGQYLSAAEKKGETKVQFISNSLVNHDGIAFKLFVTECLLSLHAFCYLMLQIFKPFRRM